MKRRLLDIPVRDTHFDAAWTVAMRRQQFGYGEISAEAHIGLRRATEIVKGWVRDGKCRQINAKTGSGRLLFEVIPEGEIVTLQVGDSVQQMWTTMRKLLSFAPTDLIAHSSVEIAPEEARSYCHTLLAADYLRVQSKALPGQREAVYRLINPTGVSAPRVKRLRCIVDQNEGRIIPMTGALS